MREFSPTQFQSSNEELKVDTDHDDKTRRFDCSFTLFFGRKNIMYVRAVLDV